MQEDDLVADVAKKLAEHIERMPPEQLKKAIDDNAEVCAAADAEIEALWDNTPVEERQRILGGTVQHSISVTATKSGINPKDDLPLAVAMMGIATRAAWAGYCKGAGLLKEDSELPKNVGKTDVRD